MEKHRRALQFSIILILALSITACSSGSGGGPGQQAAGDGTYQSGVSVTITSPDAPEIDTTDEKMDLSGTASSASGISTVTWESNRGSQGTANGTDAWEISGIPLEKGTNEISVTATDASGATRSDTIVIKRESKGTGSVTLSWIAPTERTDGTPLNNLAGYKISYGRMSKIYDFSIKIDNPGLTTYVVDGLMPGQWHFTVIAYDADGLESDFSNEAHRAVK